MSMGIKSVYKEEDYGKIELRLSEIIEEKGISRNKVSKLVGTRFEVIDKWCSGTVQKVDLDVLAKLCYVLDCSVEDLVVYRK